MGFQAPRVDREDNVTSVNCRYYWKSLKQKICQKRCY